MSNVRSRRATRSGVRHSIQSSQLLADGMRILKKLVTAGSIMIATSLAVGAERAPSSCVSGEMGKRSSMLYLVSSISFNGQIARLCNVSELAVQQRSERHLANIKACLMERNISDATVSAYIRAGEVDAQQVHGSSAAKDSVCTGIREQFAE